MCVVNLGVGWQAPKRAKRVKLYTTQFLWSRDVLGDRTGRWSKPQENSILFLTHLPTYTYRESKGLFEGGTWPSSESIMAVEGSLRGGTWPSSGSIMAAKGTYLSFHFLTVSRTKNYFMFIKHFFFLVFLCFWKHWGSCWPGPLLLSCAPVFCGRVRNDRDPVIHLCSNHLLASRAL